MYSGKQRNIYEHIYRIYSPNLLYTPPVQKLSGPTETSDKGNIFTNILYSGASSNTVKNDIKIDKDMIMLQENENTDK